MPEYRDDLVYVNARREAIFILLLWCLCLFWTVGFCYLDGYTEHPQLPGDVTAMLPDLSGFDRDPQSLQTPLGLGIPDWVFWGVAVPWGLCILISTWFCFFFMTDDQELDEPTIGNAQSGQQSLVSTASHGEAGR